MVYKCRSYAASHLGVSADLINVQYEGTRTDGTHPVNGSTESNRPLTSQCSFGPGGKKIVQFVPNAPQGCPADVSEANRYMYPDCD